MSVLTALIYCQIEPPEFSSSEFRGGQQKLVDEIQAAVV